MDFDPKEARLKSSVVLRGTNEKKSCCYATDIGRIVIEVDVHSLGHRQTHILISREWT